MLLKSKICITSLVIYEIIAVSILHFKRICDAIFTGGFCDSWYRYFLFCVAVPLVALLIWMWIHEIIRVHRRHKFIRRAKNVTSGIISSIRGHISDNISSADMEKIITAAVLIGIKRYADRHPNLRKNINNIFDIANGEIDIDLMSTDDETPKKQTRTKVQKNTKRKRTK
ncbi:MAG: hypothetical protein ACLRFO_04145 [Alphaproteobacteria bacterium]